MSKICLIYTGGTIGMVRDESGELRPPDDPKDFLQLAPELIDVTEFDFVPVMNKDSTNINHRDWTIMAQAIGERMTSGYDGFVIAHGTDTMHFSASAVAFALGTNLPCPVVFTGAQTAPAISHGDARVNLLRACEIAKMDLGEVVISFGEFVFRGCRAQKKNEARFDAFESPAQYPLGFIMEKIELNPGAKRKGSSLPEMATNRFADGVLQFSLIPGLEAELLIPAIEKEGCKGVILQSFGAGNVPDADPYSLIPLIERCVKMQKPVIVTSQFPANSTLHTAYAPGRRAVEAGAIPTSNMTGSCAAAKFRWALAQAEGANDPAAIVDKVMSTVYVDEMDPIDRSSHMGGKL
jgi:L-asparaginase type I